MAAILINLLPAKQQWQLRRKRWWRWLYSLSLVGGGVYVLGLTGILVWQWGLTRRLQATQAQISQVKAEVAAMGVKESNQVMVKSKLTWLTDRDSAAPITTQLRQVWALVPANLTISEARVETGKIGLTGKTTDPIAIAKLLTALVDQPVTLEGVNKSSSGEYGITLTLAEKKGAK